MTAGDAHETGWAYLPGKPGADSIVINISPRSFTTTLNLPVVLGKYILKRKRGRGANLKEKEEVLIPVEPISKKRGKEAMAILVELIAKK